MTVEARPVVIGRTVERDVVVEKGLSDGESIVISGQLRLAPGTRVEIKSVAPPANS
jgi:multidrug efflux system membrane fusion protein